MWVLVGSLAGFSVLSILSIGPYLAALTLIALAVAVRITRGRGAVGSLVGVGIPFAWVGLKNWDGPGTVCTSTSSQISCSELLDPAPFLVVAGVSILLGILVQLWLAARSRTGATAPPR